LYALPVSYTKFTKFNVLCPPNKETFGVRSTKSACVRPIMSKVFAHRWNGRTGDGKTCRMPWEERALYEELHLADKEKYVMQEQDRRARAERSHAGKRSREL